MLLNSHCLYTLYFVYNLGKVVGKMCSFVENTCYKHKLNLKYDLLHSKKLLLRHFAPLKCPKKNFHTF